MKIERIRRKEGNVVKRKQMLDLLYHMVCVGETDCVVVVVVVACTSLCPLLFFSITLLAFRWPIKDFETVSLCRS